MRTAVRHNSSLRLRCHGLDPQEGHARWRKFHLTELGVLTSQGEQFVVDTQFQFISVQLSARDLELLSRENVALGRQQKLDELVDGHACVDRKEASPRRDTPAGIEHRGPGSAKKGRYRERGKGRETTEFL